jgi:hypothetical protein
LSAIAGIAQALSGVAQQAGGAAPNLNFEHAICVAAGGTIVGKTLHLQSTFADTTSFQKASANTIEWLMTP